MKSGLILSLFCLFVFGCAASEQPDYGWVAKPKSSVEEYYGRGGYDRDRRYEREYYYNSVGELDSVVETNFGRTVFSNFKPAILGMRSQHSYTTFNVIPWDVSLAGTHRVEYYDSGSNRVHAISIDSLRGDELVFTTHYPNAGRFHTYRNWKEYGLHGYLSADLLGDSINWSGYHYDYTFDQARPVKIVKTFSDDSSALVNRPRPTKTGKRITDTVAIYQYTYDSFGKLRSIDLETFEGKFRRAYSRQVKISDIQLTDSITAFSRRSYNFSDFGPIGKYPLRYTSVTHSPNYESYRNTYAFVLDNRYRVIKEITDDSNEVAISYFDDNSIRERRSSVRREGKTYGSIRSRSVRKYDEQKRIVRVDSYYSEDGDERLTRRTQFKY